MAWLVEFEDAARKELGRLDRQIGERIVSFLRDRIAPLENPRSLGQALTGSEFGEFWRYRVGDYRIVCRIEDQASRVLVVRVAHRREVYR